MNKSRTDATIASLIVRLHGYYGNFQQAISSRQGVPSEKVIPDRTYKIRPIHQEAWPSATNPKTQQMNKSRTDATIASLIVRLRGYYGNFQQAISSRQGVPSEKVIPDRTYKIRPIHQEAWPSATNPKIQQIQVQYKDSRQNCLINSPASRILRQFSTGN